MFHNKQIISIADQPHHCATIAFGPTGLVLAAYVGKECTDEQRVFIKFNNTVIELEPKTGNPLLWNQDGRLMLMYSRFEDIDDQGNKPEYPVDRWKFTSMWLAEVDATDRYIHILNKRRVDEGFGILARCAPLIHNGETLIPLYREKDPQCEVWKYKDSSVVRHSIIPHSETQITELEKLKKLSRLGRGVAIQPTLFVAQNELHATCRNMTTLPYAWHSTLVHGAWMPLEQLQGFPNYNTSVLAIPKSQGSPAYWVYNTDATRAVLRMTSLMNTSGIVLSTASHNTTIKNSFSYPNYCYGEQCLYVVHTHSGKIALHMFDSEYLDHILGF